MDATGSIRMNFSMMVTVWWHLPVMDATGSIRMNFSMMVTVWWHLPVMDATPLNDSGLYSELLGKGP